MKFHVLDRITVSISVYCMSVSAKSYPQTLSIFGHCSLKLVYNANLIDLVLYKLLEPSTQQVRSKHCYIWGLING